MLVNILLWILFGALAGWIASMIAGKDRQMGPLANIVIGIVGAGVGGWIASFFGLGAVDGFNLMSLLIAVAGAVILLAIINLIKRN